MLPKAIGTSASTADHGARTGRSLYCIAVTYSGAYRRTEYRAGHCTRANPLPDWDLLSVLTTFFQIDLILRGVDVVHVHNGWAREGLLRAGGKYQHADEKKTTKHQILLRSIDVQRTS